MAIAALTPAHGQSGKTPAIVPKPQQMRLTGSTPFSLNTSTRISFRGDGAETVARMLADTLRTSTGLPLPLAKTAGQKNNTISLSVTPSEQTKTPEGYSLTADQNRVTVRANTARGLFYATQTLLQLLPPQVHARQKTASANFRIPAVSIRDYPQFPWRGIMLDVSRYFFTKQYIKRYLDMMALHKLNVLHWHLIDDAGWRIEIKKYPRLTGVGGFRGEGANRYGGYYTQDDIREIVAYAAARNITIVPEIELPAHTLPALAAYPHLGCSNKSIKVPNRHFISRDLYCAGKESTYTFLENVLDEVCALFPGKYIHIGGDEAKYDRWKKCPHCQKRIKDERLASEKELQGWMTTRIEKYLRKKGKRIIGWDEILGCGASNKAGIMTWHQPQTAIDGATRGNPVVMALVRHTYFDTPESKRPGEPPCATWTPPVSLAKAYNWHPVPDGLPAAAAQKILGPNGCVWTDQFLHQPGILADKPGQGTAASESYVDYLSLPRMAALAEVGWTARPLRSYPGFLGRMQTLYNRYDHLGYNYRVPVPDIRIRQNPDGGYTISGTPPVQGGTIRYTLDGRTPEADSPTLPGSLSIKNLADFRAATYTPGNKRHSLVFQWTDPDNKYAAHGSLIGKWTSGQVGNGKPKEATFDATGHINANGTYLVTFLYTGGQFRLDIDGIRVVRNDTTPAGQDIHHGFTGAHQKNNTYRINIKNYETGASFKIKAMIYGDQGNDTNGVVLIKKVHCTPQTHNLSGE